MSHIVIELIGGLNPGREDRARARLQSGKSVVTANKQLIARHGPDLLQLAASHGCQLEFGASVAGGVPVLPALRTGLCGDRLHGIAGILNGTCNYILSRIETRAFLSAKRSKKHRPADMPRLMLRRIWMAATRAPNWPFSRSRDCTRGSRRNRFAPARFAPSMRSTSTTPRNSAAPSARFRAPDLRSKTRKYSVRRRRPLPGAHGFALRTRAEKSQSGRDLRPVRRRHGVSWAQARAAIPRPSPSFQT